MRGPLNLGKHLRLIDRGVGRALAVRVEVGLSFPVLIEQEDTAVALRMINLKADTTRLLAGEPRLLEEQTANFKDLRFALGSENHIHVNHGELPRLNAPRQAPGELTRALVGHAADYTVRPIAGCPLGPERFLASA